MDLETMLSYEWGAMMPEFIILGVAALLSLLDLFLPKQYNRKSLAWIALAGIILSIISLISLFDLKVTSILHDTFRLDSFAKAFKLLLLVGAALVILLAESFKPKEGISEYRGEFYYLFLAALLGAMVMSSSGDLITLFVGLELLSISSYILAGFRKKHLASNESAMKYVINGGISTAITLFGMSYLYGLTGTTNLKEMSGAMSAVFDGQFQYLFGLAFFMILVGLSFKLASVPFHMWAPDVYQGSPTPVTAFLSVVSKTAGFIILLRILISLFLMTPADETGALTFLEKNNDYIGFLAGITMIAGNVIALRQRNIKRMLAYSSIAHAGYILVAIAVLGYFTFDAVWFYLAAYLFMNLGAFAVIQLITDKTGSEDISRFAGLYRTSPVLAVAMAVFILSLAGIPGTAGFIGKLTIFMGAFSADPGHYVLGAIMIGATVISYVYYFGIMTQMFFRPAIAAEKMKIPGGIIIVLALCIGGTVLFGLAPNIAFDFLHTNFGGFEDFLK
ncbi:NADH-quinone oxidoreductase subunit NuoN [Bacillus sp. M6-12]|uniref:NADH-quinone oxidoreductase subunit NuoN n=1 Tax=Bacillus sp. M6-12 TaxID=2054166 RepID=UPI000C78677E|nr:NADH-quinone oxidoreductase subunit NuoN [Bacillus sp. M6-12]PLS17744.1 NADH-quinone oxidoreductase subunit NuoN [Bacillus sp. M6-12]